MKSKKKKKKPLSSLYLKNFISAAIFVTELEIIVRWARDFIPALAISELFIWPQMPFKY